MCIHDSQSLSAQPRPTRSSKHIKPQQGLHLRTKSLLNCSGAAHIKAQNGRKGGSEFNKHTRPNLDSSITFDWRGGRGFEVGEDERRQSAHFSMVLLSFGTAFNGEWCMKRWKAKNNEHFKISLRKMVVNGDYRMFSFKSSVAINFNLSMNIILSFHLENHHGKVNRHGNKAFSCPRDSNCSFNSQPSTSW